MEMDQDMNLPAILGYLLDARALDSLAMCFFRPLATHRICRVYVLSSIISL
jgi:hypothetical protein